MESPQSITNRSVAAFASEIFGPAVPVVVYRVTPNWLVIANSGRFENARSNCMSIFHGTTLSQCKSIVENGFKVGPGEHNKNGRKCHGTYSIRGGLFIVLPSPLGVVYIN